jgi:hypothetical protein
LVYLLVIAPLRGVDTRNHFTNSNMPEQTEPANGAGDQQVRQPTAALPVALDETRRQFVEALDWAGPPLYATDGSGNTSTNIQHIAEAVQQGRQLTPEQVQQTREAIKLLDSNEIVNTRPILQQLKDTFAIVSSPEGPQPALALRLPEPAPELVQPEAKVTAPVQLKPATRPAAKAKTPNDDRDDFIRNALPVAAALRQSGKPEEAKQLELVANALLQTKSLERTPAPVQEQAISKEELLKDLLANVYKAIDQDPALKNMPEAKNMRRAGNKLEKDGMLNITVRNGVVVSFVSNFTDNFSRTQKVEPAAPEAKPVAAQAVPTPRVMATPSLAAMQAAPPVQDSAPSIVTQATLMATEAATPQVKVATIRLTFNNPEEPGRGMPDVLSKRFREAGADAEIISTKPAPVAGQSVSELKVSYRLNEPGIDKVSALLDAAAIMRGSKVQEMPGDPQARKEAAQQQDQVQAKQAGQQHEPQAQQRVPAQAREQVQQVVAQPTPLFQAYPAYTSFAPSTETGIIENRKAVPHDSPQLNIAITDKGEFGLNPKVNQQRLIGDGIASLSQFFDYALPTSGHKIAHVGLAEPGQLRQTETGWEVVTKGKLAITDTEGNVFKPQVGPAQQLAPTPAATVAQAAPGPQLTLSREEVIYAAAPPMSDGVIRKDVLSSQAAHYSIFQIQVDPRDTNRAMLLPAPGADGRLINSLRMSMENAYQVTGQPTVEKKFLAVQTPTQLARTADGWKVTEKGLIGFSAAESVYQAQSPAPAPQVVTQGRAFSVADLPVELLAEVGVPVAELERTGQLQKLLDGQKTDLIPGLQLPGPDGQPTSFAAKLLLDRDAQGVATLRVDLPKRELEIPQQVLGKEITPAMQEQLKTTGVVPLLDGFRDGKGQPFSAYLAVDTEMKRVVAVRPEGITLPQEVYGVKLSPEQQKSLLEGKPARIEGMTQPGAKQLVDALVQLDPLARKLVFRDTRPRLAPEQLQTQVPPPRRPGVRL